MCCLLTSNWLFMKVFRTSLLAVCFSFLSTMGIGQHCDICTRALVTDYISFELDEETALHYLNIVDKESYRESKEKGGFGIKNSIWRYDIRI